MFFAIAAHFGVEVVDVPGRLDEVIRRAERGLTTKDDADFLRGIRESLATATIKDGGSHAPCEET